MRAMVVNALGGPEVLEPVAVDEPRPSAGEVVVDHSFVGVNFVDTQHRSGEPYPVEVPLIVGIEAAGRVSAIGDDVEGVSPGARVAYGGIMPGVYAERAAVPVDQLVFVPDGVDEELAAAVLVQGWTAHMLAGLAGPADRATAVVFAAAGGTGSLLVQLLRAQNLHVLGISSSETKCAFIDSLGADAIDRNAVDVVAEVRQRTGGGADIVFDGVGGPAFEQARRMLRPCGQLVCYGQAAGPAPPIDPAVLSGISPAGGPGSLTLSWPTLNDHNATASQRRQRASEVFAMVEAGTVTVRVDATLGLAEAAEAHRRLEAGATIGKLVLDARDAPSV